MLTIILTAAIPVAFYLGFRYGVFITFWALRHGIQATTLKQGFQAAYRIAVKD